MDSMCPASDNCASYTGCASCVSEDALNAGDLCVWNGATSACVFGETAPMTSDVVYMDSMCESSSEERMARILTELMGKSDRHLLGIENRPQRPGRPQRP